MNEISRTLIHQRRWKFAGFNLALIMVGSAPMIWSIAQGGWTFTAMVLFTLYLILLAQVVYGFTLAVTGSWLLKRGGDPLRISQTIADSAGPQSLPATAIVMPIFNEEVARVFRGLRVMYDSLEKTGQSNAFDFFILSDSTDPNHWIAEEKAWFELCKDVQGFGRIFYRKRLLQQHNKSGNIADFCRRWGAKYQCMIVLDADSIMTGVTFVRLAAMMAANPQVGIIQTCPQPVLGRSLFQRINQFASHAYGPLYSAGANYWQLESANFFGHNAILRLDPFIKHCAMPELPAAGSLGSRILSHDTVEAAFMRRAGYFVWAAYDLEGSYEETPPHLLASLQRDRRWCHGNLQHLWVLFAGGIKIASRLNILIGIMAFANSLLWLFFLLLSPYVFSRSGATYTTMVFGFIMTLLLGPKLLAAGRLLADPKSVASGGGQTKILMNVIIEMISSMLLAPILMFFYVQFVWSSFFGTRVKWGRQIRSAETGPSWLDLVVVHLGYTFIALAWAGVIAWQVPAILPWMLLVLLGPIIAIPLSRLLASNWLGSISRDKNWFLVPAERQPVIELSQLTENLEPPLPHSFSHQNYVADFGLLQAILDPYLNAIHVSLLRERTQVSVRSHESKNELTDRLLMDGPLKLTSREKWTLLWDADGMLAAHEKLWCSPATYLNEWWQEAFRIYNESSSRRILGRSL